MIPPKSNQNACNIVRFSMCDIFLQIERNQELANALSPHAILYISVCQFKSYE